MKKVLSFMLLLATLVTFTACSDDNDEPAKSLEGTVWTAVVGTNEVWAMDFESNTTVAMFRADANLNIVGTPVRSEYTYSGSALTFKTLSIEASNRVTYRVTAAGINGNFMTGGNFEGSPQTITLHRK